jgi:putative heme-binding domain-containing protein
LETVTGGWPEPTGKAGSNLDAIGIAVNKAGEIFCGLGCDDWREAYRVNKTTGKSEYNIRSERGTILKVSADWKKREIICTGTRFPVGMAFNAAGDLFTTDQEGATWLPNGNPFDELLHIQPGRHYGFPPRHPKYLPNVIDEPSTFDYAPQHQSTCGLHFNDGKKVFGPEWWRGDAIITGESRGKIWRTKLVRTAAGYVAKSELIACLKMMPIDAVPTPQGDLIVCCHGGKPDWGTGPQGKGKLFKISYTDKNAPQPMLAYAVNPKETQVVYSRPLSGGKIHDLTNQFAITMGKYVTAGEQFESFRPGYQAVKNQRTMPRFELPVVSVKAMEDQRSLRLQTGERIEAVNYAVTIPGAAIGQPAEMDVLTDLTGVSAAWKSAGGSETWLGWLPHVDLMAARGFAAGSSIHDGLFQGIKERGTLTLQSQLDLWQMLRSTTQPDSMLDFEYPPETVTVVLKANAKLDAKAEATFKRVSEREIHLTIVPKEHQWLALEITLATGREPQLDVSWFTAEDPRPRPLPLRRVLLPWAKPYVALAVASSTPEIDGGNWANGKKIFFGEQAACSKCHKIGGEGGSIGADLSNLIFRDYASVLKDITEPSAAINPDHIAYNVQLTDGEVESGVLLKNNREEVVLGQVTGKDLTIPKDKVASMKASAISLMPEGLLKSLSVQEQKDLMTFLLNVH